MRVGKVVRYDRCSGDVCIEALRRTYRCHASEIEPGLRLRGALVLFEIEHANGAARAVRVMPMPGLRSLAVAGA